MKLGKVISWSQENKQLLLRTDSAVLGVSFAGRDILRLRLCRGCVLAEEDTYILAENTQTPGQPNAHEAFTLCEAPDSLMLESGDTRLQLGLNPLTVKVCKKSGRPLAASPDSGMGYFTADETVAQFMLEPDEKIYGLGQDPMGNLNQRDHERRMWNEWDAERRSGNAGIPFFMSSSGYGLLLNSSWASRFAIGRAEIAETSVKRARGMAPAPWPWDSSIGENHPDKLSIHLLKGYMDLFVICRDSFDEIQSAYVDLTGHPPMLPKWAFGFIQCKNRYRSQEELLFTAREYRKRNIPCDVLVIDWLWFKEFGDLEWFREDWPDPKGMLKELSDMGFHVMQAQHPYVETFSQKYKTFLEKNYLNKTPGNLKPTFDHSNPQAREGWWDEIKRLYTDGIRGYWTDMGELEEHPIGTESHLGPRERVHNIYSTLWTKALYDGQRKDFGERVFSLPRTAFAGIQKNGTALWSGDIDASWEVLRDQVVIGQGVCLSGQQYWTTDIGGFITDERFSPELYIRWFQWGVFCPVFRTHGTRPGNEAWSFGEEAERILAEYINLRYRLLPYIYSCAAKVTEKGTPIMRAMCMDYADDAIAAAQVTQFMFGPALLVAPVIEEGARSRRVYLPAGVWYDFTSGASLEGRQWIEASAPLGHIPVFAKAGSIIPMGPVAEHTGTGLPDRLEIHTYAGSSGAFELYEDDGITYDYEKGAYVKTLITMDENGNVKYGHLNGNKALIPEDRSWDVIVHSCNSGSLSQGITDISASGSNDAANQVDAFVLDSNLSSNGRLMIHLSSKKAGLCEMKLKATLNIPQGWAITGSSAGLKGSGASTLEAIVKDEAHLFWELYPAGAELPLVSECSVDIEAAQGTQTSSLVRKLAIGSGFATRWEAAGNFDNSDGKGIDKALAPEANPDMPRFADNGRILGWSRNTTREFNCFGYVDFREILPDDLVDSKGIAYARCRIWTEKEIEAYPQITGDPCIKLWINNEPVFESGSIVLDKILDKPVLLKAGWNDCLIKSAIFGGKPYSGREYGFRFRLVDKEGILLDKLLYKP